MLKMISLSTILILLVAATAGAGGAPEGEEITGIGWEWHQTLYNNHTRAVPDEFERYTVDHIGRDRHDAISYLAGMTNILYPILES